MDVSMRLFTERFNSGQETNAECRLHQLMGWVLKNKM